MLLKKRRDGKYFALITPACDMTADTCQRRPEIPSTWLVKKGG
jgi:hypothetical protein